MSKIIETKSQQVYDLLKKIPKGKVTTYGEIAKVLGFKSPRNVGRILHMNKHPDEFPCYKVVFADGKLAENFGDGGIEVQRKKLLADGIEFIGEKVNMKKHGFKF